MPRPHEVNRQPAREQIAETRLLRVLGTHTVANQRTLEQKISDAGPYNQRIDPHILNDVRKRLMKEGLIAATNRLNAPWFYAGNTPADAVETRLAELLPIYKECNAIGGRVGQVLEIATYRALCHMPSATFFGRFHDLDAKADNSMYPKDEPPQHIGMRSMKGKERLDFMLLSPEAGALGLECKNVRHWMYPHVREITEIARKCLAIDAVPVFLARRIHFSTFIVLSKCGFIFHQTYNQLFPGSFADLANKARDKNLLGYHDIRTGNIPDARLLKFITVNLPKVAAEARAKFEAHKDLLEPYANGLVAYDEFAGRVLRRWRGLNEDDSVEAEELDVQYIQDEDDEEAE
jgi:hypothetical protein